LEDEIVKEAADPRQTALVAIFGFCAVLAAAVVVSDMESGAKIWVALIGFGLMAFAIAGALGYTTAIRRYVIRVAYDWKLSNQRTVLGRFRLLIEEVEKLDGRFHNLVSSFRSYDATVERAQSLELGASNAMHALRDAVISEAKGVLPENRDGRDASTTELFASLANLAALMVGIGRFVDGLARGANQKEGNGFVGLRQTYHTFAQDYNSVTTQMTQFTQEVKVIFGRDVKFDPVRLPPL